MSRKLVTQALIIDLRKNGGGSPDGVIFWNSYLFPDSRTHLDSIYDGETGAGAHPTDHFAVTPTLEITVPIARSVNPVTGTNWEGTGVEPDIAVPEAEAFAVAYEKALRHVVAYEKALRHVVATSTSPAVQEEARAALQNARAASAEARAASAEARAALARGDGPSPGS
jgi:C-terminal processing protease CtpA/Prc